MTTEIEYRVEWEFEPGEWWPNMLTVADLGGARNAKAEHASIGRQARILRITTTTEVVE